MTTLDKTTQPQISGLAKVWQRTPVLLKAILMIALVGIVGANGIGVISVLLPGPLSLIAMLAYLFLYWKFFSGSWGPNKTAETRKKYFRAGSLSPRLWKWSLLLAALFVLVFQSSLVVTFRLIQFPADLFAQGFGFESLPLWMAWAIILIAALSAGLTEEVGFRGYGLVPLEKRYGPVLANIIDFRFVCRVSSESSLGSAVAATSLCCRLIIRRVCSSIWFFTPRHYRSHSP